MALWGTIEESKIKELWKLFQNENGSCFDSLPPEHSLLLSLFCREEIQHNSLKAFGNISLH